MSRNTLYAIIGALAVISAVLGYQYYQAHREPTGIQINGGPVGFSIEKK